MPSDVEMQAERFYRDYRPALVAYFIRRIGCRTEAEDLAQDVYLRLVSRTAAAPRDWHAYIFQIAANLLRDRARRAEVRARYVTHARQDPSIGVNNLDPHRVAADREALRALIDALSELPERTRQILLLFRYEQVSRQAIAESFGISVSAVEKHVYRAMTFLGKRLRETQ